MDYSFYLREVFRLHPDLHERLVSLVNSIPLDPETSYFVSGRHPGFTSGRFTLDGDTPPAILDLLQVLHPVFPHTTLLSYLINRVEPGGGLLEHTDAAGGEKSTGYATNGRHLIHVGVQGLARNFFRRSNELPNTEKVLRPGSVYAFNNYVYHSVRNEGTLTRYNVVLYYDDPVWETKKVLYRHLNIPLGEY